MNKRIGAVEQLNSVVDSVASRISDFTYRKEDFTRNRKLNARTTLDTILNMQGGSLNVELLDAFPEKNERMTASAFEQAKGKLKPEVFEHILHEYNKTNENIALYENKYRLFAIDGSDFTTPFNPNSEYLVDVNAGRRRKNGEDAKPYCQVHANLLYDIENRAYEDCILQPRPISNERDAALDMMKRLNCGEYIVIMDRGYDGFNMIENCNRIANCNYIIRTKAGIGGIREITNLPNEECDVEMNFRVTTSHHYYMQHRNADEPNLHLVTHHRKQYKAVRSKNTKDQRWDFGIFTNVKCRVVKFRINNTNTGKEEWEVLITNLNRFEFPIEKMKELYHLRWDIETSFRELKYALGGINFHSKKDDFIKMEIFAHLVMFNVVSRNIASVSVPKSDRKYDYAIDFKMACVITRRYYKKWQNWTPEKMYEELLSYTIPIRPGRADKRNMKPKSAVWFVYRVA